jgi:7-cyano-7-deazaguanine synthase
MKRVVVHSGGLDSSTLLAQLAHDFGNDNIIAISFNYGSKHNEMEIDAAEKLCRYYDIKREVVDLTTISKILKSNLLKKGGNIPEGHYEDPSMRSTVVPFRNAILLSIATGFCESIEADEVYLGTHAGDHAIYPDCRGEFSDAMSKAIYHGTYRGVKAIYPFLDMTKQDIVKLGLKLNVPYEYTYTCYNGNKNPCGKCGSCVERLEAFSKNNTQDPLTYANEV